MDICCEGMRRNVYCLKEQQRFDNGDVGDKVVYYDCVFDEYGIPIKDTLEEVAPSYIVIAHCPWCGAKLPDSKRERWFDELEALGYDNPMEQTIPEAYRSAEWYRKKEESV